MHKVIVSDEIRDELEALCQARQREHDMVKEANALRDGVSVLSDEWARSSEMYTEWLALCESDDLAIEALRQREWPRSTRLSVTTAGVLLLTGKTWRSAKRLYERDIELWRVREPA